MQRNRETSPAQTPHGREIDHALQWMAIQLREIEAAIREQEAELTTLRDRKAQVRAEHAALQQQRACLHREPAGAPAVRPARRAGPGRVDSSTAPRDSA